MHTLGPMSLMHNPTRGEGRAGPGSVCAGGTKGSQSTLRLGFHSVTSRLSGRVMGPKAFFPPQPSSAIWTSSLTRPGGNQWNCAQRMKMAGEAESFSQTKQFPTKLRPGSLSRGCHSTPSSPETMTEVVSPDLPISWVCDPRNNGRDHMKCMAWKSRRTLSPYLLFLSPPYLH